jgi:predicted metal-binding transcription factor (methanogenesis marker protein 9)
MSKGKKLDVSKISKKFLRDIPNWDNAPVPVCMNGDYRALTFCCKPGHSLTFGFKCQRDDVLKEVGLTPEEFMAIKVDFSQKHNWDSSETCFGSLTYCCMRQGGCHRRDFALARRYPGKSSEEALAEYYLLKKELSDIIMAEIEKRNT